MASRAHPYGDFIYETHVVAVCVTRDEWRRLANIWQPNDLVFETHFLPYIQRKSSFRLGVTASFATRKS
ncbi:hypothetical protein [Sphingomonas sp. SUN039]|uniref:hypothetical protein n=1 Tax=Sphingomonas sp. SUN039 TaxID=2937787 RepID=UPI0021643740|nr:hypothetical protein [Sphingomonas sp. SUN039]UVO53973.1 hypothetical protein M0209_07500 [Sphingomonas sp. SUN039]